MVTLMNKLVKHNFVIVMLCLIAIVTLNVLYIITPKNKMIVYKEINMPHGVVLETKNIDIDARVKLRIGGERQPVYATGWVIEAKESGEGVIVLTDEGKRQSYHYKEINITVDSDLRFHFDMDMEYVRLFYPLNLLLIIYCMIYIVLLPICKIGTLINNSTKNRNEVLQDAK